MTPEIVFVFQLMIVFQVKHLLGDYIFQTNWMVAGKTRADIGFVFPLTVHVLVHALLTLAIVYVVNKELWWLAVFDFVVHFVMDRIKSGPRYLGRYNNPAKSSFWICLGIDQMVHHLTHYAIVWWLLLHRQLIDVVG
jgi:hypothetical protein